MVKCLAEDSFWKEEALGSAPFICLCVVQKYKSCPNDHLDNTEVSFAISLVLRGRLPYAYL